MLVLREKAPDFPQSTKKRSPREMESIREIKEREELKKGILYSHLWTSGLTTEWCVHGSDLRVAKTHPTESSLERGAWTYPDWLPAKTRISTFSIEFNQDPKFHHIIFRRFKNTIQNEAAYQEARNILTRWEKTTEPKPKVIHIHYISYCGSVFVLIMGTTFAWNSLPHIWNVIF